MKHLLLSTVLLLVPIATLCAQDKAKVSDLVTDRVIDDNCGELGVVPEWVKGKTSPEEYAVMEELSRYYRLDYSFLKSKQLTEERRKEIFTTLKEECEEARKGNVKLPDEPDRCYYVSYPVADSVRAYATEPVMMKKYLLYSNINGYDAHVELSVVYSKDCQTGDIRIFGHELKAVSFSGLEVKLKLFDDHTRELTYNRENNRFECYYPGALYFTDPMGQKHVKVYSGACVRSFVP